MAFPFATMPEGIGLYEIVHITVRYTISSCFSIRDWRQLSVSFRLTNSEDGR